MTQINERVSLYAQAGEIEYNIVIAKGRLQMIHQRIAQIADEEQTKALAQVKPAAPEAKPALKRRAKA